MTTSDFPKANNNIDEPIHQIIGPSQTKLLEKTYMEESNPLEELT